MTDAPDDRAIPRDAAYWAKGISKLQLGEVPAEAVNLNVTGRRVVGPVQGFGSCGRRPTGSTWSGPGSPPPR